MIINLIMCFLVIDSSDIIIDMLSLERNYLLVKTYQIGGPSERVLPPRTLNHVSNMCVLAITNRQAD